MKKETKIVPVTGRKLVPEIVLKAESQGDGIIRIPLRRE